MATNAFGYENFDQSGYDKALAVYNAAAKKRAKEGKAPRSAKPEPKNFALNSEGQRDPNAVADPSKLGTLTGSSVGGGGAYGGKPDVANPLASQGKAIAGNISNFGALSDLTGKMNDLNFSQYTGRIGGYDDMAAASSANILSNLRGEIPDDVKYLIGQNAAERGIARGVSGSDFSNTDYLRSLGLTSLDLKRQGETGLTGAFDRVGKVGQFDTNQFLITPETINTSQNTANVIGAAADPAAQKAEEMRAAQIPFLNQQRNDASAAWQATSNAAKKLNPNFGIGDNRLYA